MSLAEDERNYTPSLWTKRHEITDVVSYFCDLALNVTQKVRSDTKCLLNVPYGTSKRTAYDIYGIDLPKDAPILVFIHGGYWQELNKECSGFTVPVFVANGIKVINVGYDLCPQVKLRDIVYQIKTAIEQILKYASECGCRCVWVGGHSVGAHLTASLLHDTNWRRHMEKLGYSQLMKGLLLIGGIYNLKPLVNLSFNEALKLTNEEIEDFSFTKLDIKDYEPIRNLRVVVTVGECDSPIFVNETREYAQKIIPLVDHVEYILLRNDIDHFNIIENLMDPEFPLTKILLQYIKS